jgi:hypothetical protein
MLKCFMISVAKMFCLYFCRNLNIGFVTKYGMQGPMKLKECLGVKCTFTNGGECKGWSPMTPKCIPTLGVALVQESKMFKALVGKEKKTPNWAPRIPLEIS